MTNSEFSNDLSILTEIIHNFFLINLMNQMKKRMSNRTLSIWPLLFLLTVSTQFEYSYFLVIWGINKIHSDTCRHSLKFHKHVVLSAPSLHGVSQNDCAVGRLSICSFNCLCSCILITSVIMQVCTFPSSMTANSQWFKLLVSFPSQEQ